jgi:Polysulphide reductase, NrfD
VPMRAAFKLDDLITMRHIHNMTKIMLATGMIVAYAYVNEVFYAWYSGNLYEQFMMHNRQTGPYGPFYWMLIAINACMIQLFWFRKVRDNVVLLFVLSLLVNVGMWLERFVIIVTSLHRSYLPSSWVMYKPTIIEVGTLLGSFGLFFSCFLLFIRLLPMIAMWEVKGGHFAGAHAHGPARDDRASGIGQGAPAHG